MTEKQIVITELDRKRLVDLILDAQSGEYRGSVYLDNLRGELHRAQIVTPQEIPADTITMNSKVALLDLDTREEEIYTLVYPEKRRFSRRQNLDPGSRWHSHARILCWRCLRVGRPCW